MTHSSPYPSSSIKPPESLRRRPIPQLLRRDVPHVDLALPGVPALVIRNHPRAERQSEQEAGAAERGGRGERGYVLGLVLVLEDVGADDAHEVGEGHGDGGEEDAPALVGDVVVVPLNSVSGGAGTFSLRQEVYTYDVKQHRRGRRSPEGCR